MTRENVFNELVRNIYDIIPDLEGKPITEDDSLKALGANSIDRADIIMSTLESFDLRIPMINFGTAKNIRDIVDVFLKG